MFSVEGGADGGQPADRQGRDGRRLRLGPHGARRDPRGPQAWACEVPRDFSVVGYDDSTLIAFTDPPLTTVRQSVQAMSEAAVRALLDEIAGRAVAPGGVRLPARARGARLDRRRAPLAGHGRHGSRSHQGAAPVAPHGRPWPAAGLVRQLRPCADLAATNSCQGRHHAGDVLDPVARGGLPGADLDGDVAAAGSSASKASLVGDVVAEVERAPAPTRRREGDAAAVPLSACEDGQLDDLLALAAP